MMVSLLTHTVYPKKYAHGFCFAVLCCGYTLTDVPISIRLTSLALWQSNDCLSASKATLMNMDKYFMWIHYDRLHNHNKAKHNKTVCIFLGIYCICVTRLQWVKARKLIAGCGRHLAKAHFIVSKYLISFLKIALTMVATNHTKSYWLNKYGRRLLSYCTYIEG